MSEPDWGFLERPEILEALHAQVNRWRALIGDTSTDDLRQEAFIWTARHPALWGHPDMLETYRSKLWYHLRRVRHKERTQQAPGELVQEQETT